MVDKVIRWLGSSLDDLRAFPDRARSAAGYQLRRVQLGLMPSDWKLMKAVGTGVYEIRIHTGAEHRLFMSPSTTTLSMSCTHSKSAHDRLVRPILLWPATD